MKKQLIATAAIATGLVSTIGTAHADTVELPLPTTARTEPALVEKEAPKKVEVKTPTKEEVADLKQAKDDAQKIADKATPEVIQGAEKKVKTAKASVPTAEQAVSSAQ